MSVRAAGSLPKWLLAFMLASALTLLVSCSTPQAVRMNSWTAAGAQRLEAMMAARGGSQWPGRCRF